jgi:hypothetical protein
MVWNISSGWYRSHRNCIENHDIISGGIFEKDHPTPKMDAIGDDLPIFQFLVPFKWDILPLRVDVGLFWGLLILLGKVGKVSNK